MNDQKFLDIAKALGMNPQKFDAKMKDPEIRAKVRRDSEEGKRAGVRGTPTIFINGRLLKNRSLKSFQDQIDRELKAHNKKKAPETG